MPPIYLDHNATAPLLPEARAAVLDALDRGLGHPAARHRPGRRARDVVEAAREAIAKLTHRAPSQVTLTSGATEANVTAVHSLRAAGARRFLLGATEHASLRAVLADATLLPVDAHGEHDLDALNTLLPHHDALILLAAEPETGVLTDLAAVAALTRHHGVPWHCDAVQLAGRTSLAHLSADSITVSGHKLGAPTGAGALVHRGPLTPLLPSLHPDVDRGGTPDLIALAGLIAAIPVVVRALSDGTWTRVAALRDDLERRLPDAHRFGRRRLPNTSLLSFDVDALTLVEHLALRDIAVGTGSACTTGTGPSPTLLAMGVPSAVASTALRVSLGPTSSAADIDALVDALTELVQAPPT